MHTESSTASKFIRRQLDLGGDVLVSMPPSIQLPLIDSRLYLHQLGQLRFMISRPLSEALICKSDLNCKDGSCNFVSEMQANSHLLSLFCSSRPPGTKQFTTLGSFTVETGDVSEATADQVYAAKKPAKRDIENFDAGDFDLGDHNTNDAKGTVKENHYGKPKKKAVVEDHHDDCGDDISQIDLPETPTSAAAQFVFFDGCSTPGFQQDVPELLFNSQFYNWHLSGSDVAYHSHLLPLFFMILMKLLFS